MKSLQAKIAEKTLHLLRTNEWESISIEMICRKLKLSKKKIPSDINNKNDLIKNINKYIDDLIIVKIKSIEQSSPQDMIFEIFMLRFDLLNRYRFSIMKIFKVFKKNPEYFIIFLPFFITSIEMMAKSSNIETKGIVGTMKVKGLMVIYFSTFLTWVKDESISLDKTMIALDRYIEKAEKILQLLKKQNG